MPSTLTPGRPAAIGQDGPDASIPAEPPGLAEPPGPRLITVPAGWPPYDCEAHGAACPAAGGESADATAGVPTAGVPIACVPTAGVPTAGVPTAGVAAPASAGADGDQASADRAEADRATAWSRRFAQVLVEILGGARPSRQVIPWTTEPVRAQIDHLSHEFGPGQPLRIQRVMTSRPTARAVEMTVVVSFGTRSKALAMRLEHVPARHPAPGRPARPARWLCTEIEAG